MPIVITGATGLVGRALVASWVAAGETVRVVSREPGQVVTLGPKAEGISWDPAALARACSGASAVVNLAGENLTARRWTTAQKERLRASRLDATRACVTAIGAATPRPPVFVSASAVGFYGPRGDEPLDEAASSGGDFLAGLCRDWEAEAAKAEAHKVRVVRLRIGVVLTRDGGALKQMALPFRLFVGGPVTPGSQCISWIHRDDLVSLIRFACENVSLAGVVNATAPDPRTNREFARALGRALHRPAVLPTPRLALRLALGEVADVIRTGQRVLPARATAAGFTFRHATLESALAAEYGPRAA